MAMSWTIRGQPIRRAHRHLWRRLVFSLFLASVTLTVAGQESGHALFHVTSVRTEDATDWCTTGNCSATRLIVEGYIKDEDQSTSVEYVLHCVEVLASNPSPHFTIVCSHVHAHNDYLVKVFDKAIAFDSQEKPTKDGPTIAAYDIVSEKEVTARPKTR